MSGDANMKKIETSEMENPWARFDATTDQEAHAIALAECAA
jgi:hypothetical protein